MPKLIDHDQRKQEIAEAVWRLILRHGITAVSVRDVAAEADLSTGSLRHTFASKADLLAYSMRLVHVRARYRILTHVTVAEPRARALAMLSELLPLDDVRRCEMEVNLALVAEAPAHPELGAIALDAQRDMRLGCGKILADLARHGLVAASRDIDAEAMHLHALIDGAAMHAVLGETDSPESALRMVTEHLDSLAG
ncbi:TetR/AcrR family transcriptional regulator [Rhodococcus sp. NPDC003348]